MAAEEDDALPGIDDAIALLERIAAEPARLATLSHETRVRLAKAAGLVSRPDRHERKKVRRAIDKRRREGDRRADREVLDRAGIREARRAPVFATPPILPEDTAEPPAPPLRGERTCYVCKARFTQLHHFYDQLCGPCAELNWEKRHASADLTGRVALVTGARVKIGYHAAIKLLRAGAHVVVLTRFARDAAARYAREADFAQWSGRLEIHGLDLRHTPSVEALAAHLVATLPRLDYLLNNACQTVRRPPAFYRHMIEAERAIALPAHTAPLLASWESARATRRAVGLAAAAELSLMPVVPGDELEDLALFPRDRLDADLQQVDLRGRNSWRLTLAEVPTAELLEVHLVNAVAPFVLTSRLKPLMTRVPTRDAHVVQVSAMEGQFYRAWKTDRHPHTNMAKAALNMLVRTSASDYVKDGIHMNAVDTGWVTDEDPVEIAARKTEEHGFHPPLDVVDGAARICDPIFHGVTTGEHYVGRFLKDYRPTRW